jgi:SNF family Na+-dependent transporter
MFNSLLIRVTKNIFSGIKGLECFACSGSMKPENCNIAKCDQGSELCFVMIPNTAEESVVRGCLPASTDFAKGTLTRNFSLQHVG